MWIVELVLKFLASIIGSVISDKRVEATENVIKEIENAQDANDVGIRTLDDVVGRLRNAQASGVGTDPAKPL